MSTDTETLRRAATEIRADWELTTGPAWDKDQQFYLAVADWLTREAALHDAIGAVGDLMNAAAKGLGTSEVRIQFSEHDEMAASTMPQALAVARAYLGETA